MISDRLTALLAFERFHHCPAALRSAAQQSLPVAVAIVNAATAERFIFAVVKLVFRTAMVRTVISAAQPIVGAVVAEPWRQRRRVLPVRQNEPRSRRQFIGLLCGTDRRPRDASQQNKRKGFHRHRPKSETSRRAYPNMRAKVIRRSMARPSTQGARLQAAAIPPPPPLA